ncbi:hypothetical protein EJB05_37800 [Eragrostis curvula]|uniref:Uncharacterized protein n=1 Tax=Eragrostis curvula TaxID=38414 RepID=A0A5J9TSZ4_9POAL|nr:hypothetical protein EJB05_37800 [Eragrostis curvula]
MEALLELEKVQKVLSFMSSRGLSDTGGGGAAADRFLAQFILFLVKPFDSLSMEKKFLLVSELLEKATPDTLEEVKLHTGMEADQDLSSGALLQPNKKCKLDTEKLTTQALPMVGFEAMARANSTLEDFVRNLNHNTIELLCGDILMQDVSRSPRRSYFMFHGLDANNPQALFKYLPVLSFTESYIYQVLERKEEAFDGTTLSEMIDPLSSLLQRQGLMTDRLRTELESGIQYWSLERKLCQALARNEKISTEDVMKAILLKSFDYRVLNLLMYQLTGKQVNELHMEFLSVSEFLVEISDDLYDYEDDVMNNTFNVLRMFVAIYGPSEAPNMLAECIGKAEEKYESFSKKLDPSLSGSYWRRCEEATNEGGKVSGHAYGTWNIPPIINDEGLFRLERLNKHNASSVTII